MTKVRKTLLAVAIAAAITVPVGVAYAAQDAGTGRGPVAGMMAAPEMDREDCPGEHAAHQAQMGQHHGDTSRMPGHTGMTGGAMHHGTGAMSGR